MEISGYDLMAMLAAVALAGLGGELFLKGVLGAATALRVPRVLVATTLAAFATSSPELTVSSVAALAGTPEIGLGDALGSNVVNIALLFGLALLLGPIRIERREFGRDFALTLGLPLLTFLFVTDGVISRGEGAFLLLIFLVWMGTLIRAGIGSRAIDTAPADARPWTSMLLGIAGLASLILAGRLFVSGASGVAAAFGVDAYIVGATVVAIGTSLPELVTVLLARLRGHDDVGVGTLLGSNLFNSMAVIGTAASIHPIAAPPTEVSAALGFGLLSLLLLIPGRAGLIGRGRGVLLLGCYAGFVAVTIAAGRAL